MVPTPLFTRLTDVIYSHDRDAPVVVMAKGWREDEIVYIPHHGWAVNYPAVGIVKIGRPAMAHGDTRPQRYASLIYHELTHAVGGKETDAQVIAHVLGSKRVNYDDLRREQEGQRIRGTYYVLDIHDGWIWHHAWRLWPSTPLE
jgi:hypothetical protein